MTAVRNAWDAVLRFWFTPADPTAMGFIRVVVGCLVLYTHLVYSFDLVPFFGKQAWYDLDTADRTRREKPEVRPPLFWEHEQTYKSPPVPVTEAGRVAVFGWLRRLPGEASEQAKAVRAFDANGVCGPTRSYLTAQKEIEWEIALDSSRSNTTDPYKRLFSVIVLGYAQNLGPLPASRVESLAKITDKTRRGPNDNVRVPEVFDQLTDAQRKELAADLDAFAATLPSDEKERDTVITHLQNLAPGGRDNTLLFLRNAAADRVPEFERARRIDYLERWGYDERHAHRTGSPLFSVWFHVTERDEMIVVHSLILVVMALFTVGLFTRITSVLTWLAALSYLHRDPQVLFGQDTMMVICLLYLMIADSGAALSLDRVIARYRAARASLARGGTLDAPTAAFLVAPRPSAACGFAQRMLQINFCFIYLASGLSKLKGGTWWSGDAMWVTLVNPEFTMLHWDWYQMLLKTMFSSRPLYSVVAAGGVAFTLAAEIGLPFLVWTRLRPVVVIMGLMLHLGIGVFMGLLVFSLFMMAMLVGFLPGWVIREHLFGVAKPDERKRLNVDKADRKSVHAAAWAVAWDTRGKVVV
jgi:hypothetical protein